MAITYIYDIPDVMCGSCTGTIEEALRCSPFFSKQSFGADPIAKKLTVTLDDDHLSYVEVRDLLNDVLEPVGFICKDVDESIRVRETHSWLMHVVLGTVGVATGLVLLCLSFFGALPFVINALIALASIALTLALGFESYQKAWKKLKTGVLTMDSLFSISTLTILTVSTASLFFPALALPMMFEAGLLIFGFRHVGLAVEHALKRKSGVTRRFQDDAPAYVIKYVAGVRTKVPLASIRKGDVIVLQEGDILPVDGAFAEGDGLILDRIITGSHQPRRLVVGESLYAGTRVFQARTPLLFRASAAADQSHLARLDAKIVRAKLEKASLQTITTRVLQYFIPFVLVLALVSAVTVGSLVSIAAAIQCATTVLGSACPCTLGLIVPLAIQVGMRKAADAGAVFNSAEKLETASHIQAVVFDLNGTLTCGMPRVVRHGATKTSSCTEHAILRMMAHFEGDSTHPVAQAIRLASPSTLHGDVTLVSQDHAGRVVKWEGETYALGSEALMLQQGISPSALAALRHAIHPNDDESVVYLAREGQLIGYTLLHDPLRDDAVEVIKTLDIMGIIPYVCTGADEKTALSLAKRLGIAPEHVRANCVSHADATSHQSKKKVLDDLKAKGLRVAVVGDSENDVEMIAAADVGFAIRSYGKNEHIERQASAVIQGDALLPIVHAFRVAQQTVMNIKQNLMFSLVYNILAIVVTSGPLLVFGVMLNPGVGAALMILQTSIILLNVYRFAKQSCTISMAHKPRTPANQANNVNADHVSSMCLSLGFGVKRCAQPTEKEGTSFALPLSPSARLSRYVVSSPQRGCHVNASFFSQATPCTSVALPTRASDVCFGA